MIKNLYLFTFVVLVTIPATGLASEQSSHFAGAPRGVMSAFLIGDQAYVGLGLRSKDIWVYKP